jgi:hypothetical protein
MIIPDGNVAWKRLVITENVLWGCDDEMISCVFLQFSDSWARLAK